MPRRGKVIKREIYPDSRYNSEMVVQIIHRIMQDGKKRKAENIVYNALDIASERIKRAPIELLEQALRNSTPLLEVKPRRVAGATYRVPVEVKGNRGTSLAIRWLVNTKRQVDG
jgi:small subunit ribosomal protein S7